MEVEGAERWEWRQAKEDERERERDSSRKRIFPEARNNTKKEKRNKSKGW